MAQKRVTVKKKVRKKVATKRPPGAMPGHGPGPGGIAGRPPGSPARRPPRPTPAGEGIGVGTILLLAFGLAFVALVVYVFLPVDLSHVDGYPFRPGSRQEEPRNLLLEAENQLIKGKGSVTFSEEEVNHYLNERLKPSQGGPFGMVIEVDGIYADLVPDAATFYLVRSVFGRPFVISTTWDYYLSDRKQVRECTASSVGRLRVKGRMLRPIMMPFLRLAQTCRREVDLLGHEGIRHAKLEDGRLVLHVNRS